MPKELITRVSPICLVWSVCLLAHVGVYAPFLQVQNFLHSVVIYLPRQPITELVPSSFFALKQGEKKKGKKIRATERRKEEKKKRNW